MNPSYFRLKVTLTEAVSRVEDWAGQEVLQPPTPVESASEALDRAVDELGHWRGSALFVYQHDAWTVFEDLSGGFSWIPATEWLRLAGTDDLVVAGYNDAISCGELIVIRAGKIIREFAEDDSDPDEEVLNQGHSPEEEGPEPFSSWIDVAGFVDEDKHLLCEDGLFWLLGKAK